MKKIYILLLLIQTVTNCHEFNPNQTTTIFYLERNNEIVEIPVTVSWSVEKYDPTKDRSDYIDLSEIME